MSTRSPTSTLWAAVMVLRLKAWVPFGTNQRSLKGYVTSGFCWLADVDLL
jgi:hypothetical protein